MSHLSNTARRMRLLPIALLLITLTACFSLPTNSDIEAYKQIPEEQDDAGYAGASVVAVMALDDLTKTFAQNNTLTYAQALDAVTAYARAKQQAGRDSFQLGLEIGLARKTPSGTRTVSSDTPQGGPTTTNINQSVSVVTSAGQPASLTFIFNTPTSVTSADFASKTVTINPAIAHQAADQLLKLTNMMNQQYNSIPHNPKDEDVYIVQIKAGLQPYKPLLPLDAYLHLTLLPDLSILQNNTDSKALKNPPRLVPIAFGSEEYEFSSSGVSEEYLRGLALGLNASSTWGGLNFGMRQMLSSLTQINATDVNGLIVSVPFSPNSIQVRLGAMWQGSAERAMIPRNFNGFFALIVPRNAKSQKYALMTKTYFRKPVDGKALRGTRGDEIVTDIKREFCTYNLALRQGCALAPNKSEASPTYSQITAGEDWFAFLNNIRRNDLSVLQCVQLTDAYQKDVVQKTAKKADCLTIAVGADDEKILPNAGYDKNKLPPAPLLEKFIVSLNKIALKDRISYSVVVLPESASGKSDQPKPSAVAPQPR
jgi:hypothetical protein